ncbi:MAG: acyl--CoA ligase [Candidatus Methylopumilus sp.]|nr:acyl--CoA ligase [Candidatus Methylopumilus sp.]
MMLTLHDPQKTRENYASGAWHADTMFGLLQQHAHARPDTIALRDLFTTLTWSQVLQAVEQLALELHQAGLSAGDRVAIWLPSRVESVLVFMACSRNGYVCCPSLHQSYTSGEIITLLKRIRCKAFFTTPGYGSDAATQPISALLSEVPTLIRTCFYGPTFADATQTVDHDTTGLKTIAEAAPAPGLPPADTNPDKIVYLAFTSGTTGLPKGVMHSDNTLLANGRMMVRDWHHDQHSILVALSPLSHHIGTVSIEQWLAAGLQLVIHNFAAGKPALDWIIESQGTYVMGVPTHAMDILEDVRRRGLTAMGQVTSFYMAGSPIPREVAEQFLRIGVTPQNVYGMTENGSHQYTLPTDPTSTIVATCGRAAQGYEVRIFDAEHPDHEVAQGQVGEIGGRGGLLMLGYFDDQTATENSFNRSGWFMSGDLGVFDEQGCLQIVGRKKDLIIRGGHNIHPARIEDLTHRHPDVVKAAVFPIADDRLGERVCLSILQRAGATIDPQQVLQHLHEVGLSKYDMPEYFIVMPAFPLTASGKILKRELIEMTKRGDIKPAPVRWKAPA